MVLQVITSAKAGSFLSQRVFFYLEQHIFRDFKDLCRSTPYKTLVFRHEYGVLLFQKNMYYESAVV